MDELSEDAKVIAASNLTLAFFVREHTLATLGQAKELRDDSEACVHDFFENFKNFLDK